MGSLFRFERFDLGEQPVLDRFEALVVFDFAPPLVGHVEDVEHLIEMRGSSNGKYLSLTCLVYVTSKPQLDDIYRSLTSHPMVKVVL